MRTTPFAPPLITAWLAVLLVILTPAASHAESYIVEEGQPRAEIVITDQPPRMVIFAADELQTYIRKISGATLPIVHAPSDDVPVAIYVGRSVHTDALSVTDEGLEHGAFRMASGDDWLVLLGRDSDFTPPEPWARHAGDRERVMQEWDELTGAKWNNPVGLSLYRWAYNRKLEIWSYDERGSFNAVSQFLRDLGVRWYMPGELGEIVPERRTIALPQLDRTVRPDYESRWIDFFGRFTASEDDIRWYMRLGLNHGKEVMGIGGTQSHGLRNVHGRDETKQAHPEYYALLGGERDTEYGGKGKPCLSSPELFEQTVRYARALFDIYDLPAVSVGPQDGYTRLCECHLCEGKDTPERGWDGTLSDYVWDFVNRVAKEVYKTHPDKVIVNGAYGRYTLPPTTIDKLSPNVGVQFVHGRGKHFDEPEVRAEKLALLEAWQEKASHKMFIKEHYVFTHRGTFLPVYFPRAIAAGLRTLKDISIGEHIETAWGPAEVRGHGLHEPGFNHLNVYVTARYYWDADQNLDALLNEYYDKFYGPAAPEMQAFIEASEEHWPDLGATPAPDEKQQVIEKIDTILGHLADAEAKVEPASPYGRRVALLVDYLKPLAHRRDQLARGRENVPKVRILNQNDADVTLDGKLDESAWQRARAFSLRELGTGDTPEHGTTVRAFWQGGRLEGPLYIAVHCEESNTDSIRIGTTEHDDHNIWNGDHIELLLETQAHSYYQLVVNPAGALTDIDRKDGAINMDWSSQVDVATHINDNAWTVELRIPVPGTDTTGDPLNDLVGRRPTEDYPWHINVGRHRQRQGDRVFSVLAPTDKEKFHDVMRFGKLYVR